MSASDPVDVREQRLALALADYLDRVARGEPVEAAAFCREHADLAPDLLPQIDAAAEFDTLGPDDVALAPPAPPPQHPARLSGHRILRELGSGGMGRVYLAADEGLNREVAIKTLRPRFLDDAPLRERFLNEARAQARLAHPNIVRVYGLGAAGDEPPHFVMEYIEGRPLTDAAARLSLDAALELFAKVVRTVEFLHRSGLLHRDLKPANILVGADLEPKLLDFGLALEYHDERRLTQHGQVAGTPAYFSPEQAAGRRDLDARSDVFSLGAILYELLTHTAPFPAAGAADQLRAIRERDPVLPRRISSAIPGPLQNIVLKALEKNPADRYATALELAEDIDRYLAGEPVLAQPPAYARMIETRRAQHLEEIAGWHRDRIISDGEYDALRRGYERLEERSDAWILEMRRLSLVHVSLYLGAWLLVVVAGLIAALRASGLHGAAAVSVVAASTAVSAWAGLRLWRRGELRLALAFLLAGCALLPLAIATAMSEASWLAGIERPAREWFAARPAGEGWKPLTNLQLWWALLLSLPGYLWLRRFTSSAAFSMVMAAAAAAFSMVSLLRMGLLEWIEQDPGRFYFSLIPVALAFFAAAFWLERTRHPQDSRYFYPFAVVFTYVALSGVALVHEPYRNWLESTFAWTRGQIEYLFLINAAIYTALQALCDTVPTAQMRAVAKAFRFVLPGHVLVSLLLLGLAAAEKPEWHREAQVFEILLPAAACAFVFSSVPKQMKNFFASGILFLAIGLVRLQRGLLAGHGAWPLTLLAAGLALMLAAARYPALRRFAAAQLSSRATAIRRPL